MMERLQKIIARAGIVSRRKAEVLIREGQVTVNGQVVRALGSKADPERDHIKVAGKLLHLPAAPVYVLLHKPANCLTTASDPKGRATVYGLLHGVTARVFPVGRLAYHAEGLVLLTSHGEWAQQWVEADLPQTYQIKIKGKLSPAELVELRAKTAAERMSVRLLKDATNAWYECILRESRRDRLGQALTRMGHPIEKLRRVRMGPLELGRLQPGAWRYLTAREVERIKHLRAAPRQARHLARAV